MRIGKKGLYEEISSHSPRIASVTSSNNQIYDFYGFPDALYKIKYRPPEAPEVAQRVHDLLKQAGIECNLDNHRGLDHGTWNPLVVLYPEHDVPVVQLSLLEGLDPQAHIKMGEALRPLLKEEGILVSYQTNTFLFSRLSAVVLQRTTSVAHGKEFQLINGLTHLKTGFSLP